MDYDMKQFCWIIVAMILVIVLVTAAAATHGRRVDDEKYLYTVTWRSPNGEVRTYERATEPDSQNGRTEFRLPDGTKVVIRDGATEFKKNAEKR